MKSYTLKLTLILLAVCLVGTLAVYAESAYTFPVQNGTPIEANKGMMPITTQTFTVSDVASEAVSWSTYLPLGCTGFEARVVSGEVITAANAANLATGSFLTRRGKLYASGSTILWTGIGGTFNGIVNANSGNATVTIDITW